MLSCMECGACCTHPVDLKWVEVTKKDAEHIFPHFLQEGDREMYAMKMLVNRCCCLVGTVGKSCKCAIYDNRPTICRTVQPGDELCLSSLKYYGLTDRL